MNNRKIVVLTPVKNEAWILDRFLSVTSLFADHIIIADQYSTDGSLEIYRKYPKVILIENKSATFNEAERQELLINTARELFGVNTILLAIDADEILAANALATPDWKAMLNANAGTILYFEKPTLYKTTATAIRYDGGGWPLGFVDDGSKHNPSHIHSKRIPTPDHAKKLYVNEVKFLHYALVRLDAQASKHRMYCVIENIKRTNSLRFRLRKYDSKFDYSNEGNRQEESKSEWFKHWEEQGIDMHTIPHPEFFWYDYEVLKLLRQHGLYRFALDDIWNFDWERFRLKAISEGFKFAPEQTIRRPAPYLSAIASKSILLLDKIILKFRALLR